MKKNARGFTLIEVMVGVGLLGMGVAASLTLFRMTTDRMSWTEKRETAMNIATMRADYIGTRDLALLPNCAGPVSCRASSRAYSTQMSASAGYRCTQFTDGDTMPDPYVAITAGTYRIDTIVRPHPDLVGQPNARMVTVSVCWTDGSNDVQQVQFRRLLAYDETL